MGVAAHNLGAETPYGIVCETMMVGHDDDSNAPKCGKGLCDELVLSSHPGGIIVTKSLELVILRQIREGGKEMLFASRTGCRRRVIGR